MVAFSSNFEKGAIMTPTERRIDFLKQLAKFLYVANEVYGIELIAYSFHRTAEQQNALYQKGRTKPGKIVTNKDGYKKRSNHQRWLAVDFVIVRNGKCIWSDRMRYAILGNIWMRLGGNWGGLWETITDVYHFEYGG